MMKVLLVGIYDTNTVSLAPRVLKSYVNQFDVSSKFKMVTKEFSIFSNSVESMIYAINEENPDVVGYSAYIWNINEILEIVKHIDAINIVGGPQVTGIEKELIRKNPNMDIIVTGEGEETFKELSEYFSGAKRLEQIKGITTKDMKTEPRGVINDLDSIPSIYSEIFKEYLNLSWISYETSRGCPMGCKFCSWGYTKRIRYFSLGRVKRELGIILNQDSIRHIYLCDSSILLNKNRAKEILQYIINSGTDKSIRFEFRPEDLDDEIIDLLAQLQNDEFNFGIQTTNKRAMDDMGRRFNGKRFEENYHKVVKKFRESNITVDVIYGLPGDDIDGYKESLNYAISLDNVKWILTNPLIILPGSEFYYEMDRYKIKLKDRRTYVIKENYTFSEEEMELAKKYSFFVSVIYLNYRLRDCIKSFAEWQKKKYIETIIEFMESLAFDITGGLGYPYMIPSVKEDFKQRNKGVRSVIDKYTDIVASFKAFSHNKYDSMLADYEDYYSDQYYKLKRFANAE